MVLFQIKTSIMNIKVIFCILLLLFSVICHAQNRQISIKVIDSLTSEPVSDVLVFIENANCDVRTDSNGQCVLSPQCLKSSTVCFIVRAPFVRKKFCITTSSDYSSTFIIPISREKIKKLEKEHPEGNILLYR